MEAKQQAVKGPPSGEGYSDGWREDLSSRSAHHDLDQSSSLVSQDSDDEPAPSGKCSLCESATPSVACHPCDARLCQACSDTLHSTGIFTSHIIIPLVDGVPSGDPCTADGNIPLPSALEATASDARARSQEHVESLVTALQASERLHKGCEIGIQEVQVLEQQAQARAAHHVSSLVLAINTARQNMSRQVDRLVQSKSSRLQEALAEVAVVAEEMHVLQMSVDETLASADVEELSQSACDALELSVSKLADSLTQAQLMAPSTAFSADLDILGPLRAIQSLTGRAGMPFRQQEANSVSDTMDSSFSVPGITSPSKSSTFGEPELITSPVSAQGSRRIHSWNTNAGSSDASVGGGSSQTITHSTATDSISGRSALGSGSSTRQIDQNQYVRVGHNGDRLILTSQNSPDAMTDVMGIISTRPSLTSIDLTGCMIGAQGCSLLSTALEANVFLTTVGLSSNAIGDEGVERLSQTIARHPGISTCYLRGNSISHVGISSLARSIVQSSSLTSLVLKHNSCGPDGANALSDVLKSTNCSLRNLDLANNGLGFSGIAAVAEGVAGNASLQDLDLSNNDAGDAGLGSLTDALKVNQSIRKLVFRSNGVGGAGLAYLLERASSIHGLKELHIWGNHTTEAGEAILSDISVAQPNLRVLK